MRIYIELKRDAVPQVALNKLYKHTPLQTTFGYNAVALVDGVPRTLSLLELVRHYLDHQRDVVTRRLEVRAPQRRPPRAHPRGLPDRARQHRRGDRADPRLRQHRGRPRRADGALRALASFRPRRSSSFGSRVLTGLERKRIEERVRRPPGADRRAARASSATRRRSTGSIREELLELKTTYGENDERRTEIVAAEGELDLEDMIAEEPMMIAITRSGYIKRLSPDTYREQRRGGIGVMGMELKDEDYIEHLFVASTHDYLLFFTSVGKVYRLKVHELPLGSRQAKGRAISQPAALPPGRAGAGGDPDAQLRGGRVPALRDEERRRQEDAPGGVQHAAQGRRDHRDQHARGRRARRGAPLLARATTSCSSRARVRRSASARRTRARWAARPRASAG